MSFEQLIKIQPPADRIYKLSDLEVEKELGAGAYGKVSQVRHIKTKKLMAQKQISKALIRSVGMTHQIQNEINIMYEISADDHPNIIQFYSHIEDENYIYIYLEYAPNGNLKDKINKAFQGRLNEKKAAKYLKDVALGLQYLHKKNIIHRDLKPENVLLMQNETAKLADFGWSNYISDQNQRNTFCGTTIYLAPEMLTQTHQHDFSVDIWDYGILMFELLTGKPPFLSNKIMKQDITLQQLEDDTKDNIKNLKYEFPLDFPPLARNLISSILVRDPRQRLNWKQILEHKLFKEYNKNPEHSDIITPSGSKNQQIQFSNSPSKFQNPIDYTQNSQNNESTQIIDQSRKAASLDLGYVENINHFDDNNKNGTERDALKKKQSQTNADTKILKISFPLQSVDQNNDTNRDLQQELERVKKQKDKYKASLEKKKVEIEKLKSEVIELKQNRKSQQGQGTFEQKKYATLEEQYNKIVQENKFEVTELKKKIEQYKTNKMQLQKDINQLKDQNIMLTRENDAAVAKLNSIQQLLQNCLQNQQNSKELEELKSNLLEKEIEIMEQQNVIKQLEETIEQNRDEAEDLHRKQIKEIDSLNFKIQQIIIDLQKQHKNDGLETNSANSKEIKLTQLINKNTLCKHQIGQLQIENQTLQAKIKEYERILKTK